MSAPVELPQVSYPCGAVELEGGVTGGLPTLPFNHRIPALNLIPVVTFLTPLAEQLSDLKDR